jgi:hypothetical protein
LKVSTQSLRTFNKISAIPKKGNKKTFVNVPPKPEVPLYPSKSRNNTTNLNTHFLTLTSLEQNSIIPTTNEVSNKPNIQEEGGRLDMFSDQENGHNLFLNQTLPNPNKFTNFSCESCAKEFDQENDFIGHVATEHKFMCRVCTQNFEKLKTLSE